MIVKNPGKKNQKNCNLTNKQGYELGIGPDVIGGRKNLRFITGAENRAKWDRHQDSDVVQSIIGEDYGLWK